jgi:hypothetical protein
MVMMVQRAVRTAMCGALLGASCLLLAPALGSAPSGAATTGAQTVWLCRPGTANDPCDTSLASTAVTGTGATAVSTAATPPAQSVDCFYVYPTVSTELTLNADLTVQPAEVAAAYSQASRFSQVCNVWAPMYRQLTLQSLADGQILSQAGRNIAYASLLSAWKDYLAHDNDGRPIVFIGHSQGSALLIQLLRSQVDPSPTLRRRMLSAIILGGNVQVPEGRVVGGSFSHIPVCTSAKQTGCVIAYSSFGSPPPPGSFFGRAGSGVSLQSGQTRARGQQVACVNPVTFSAKAGPLLPYFPSAASKPRRVKVATPWVSYPGLYTARCRTSGGATWLQVDTTPSPDDPRPTVSPTLGPLWGYHLDDVNLALGDLVYDVATQEASAHR